MSHFVLSMAFPAGEVGVLGVIPALERERDGSGEMRHLGGYSLGVRLGAPESVRPCLSWCSRLVTGCGGRKLPWHPARAGVKRVLFKVARKAVTCFTTNPRVVRTGRKGVWLRPVLRTRAPRRTVAQAAAADCLTSSEGRVPLRRANHRGQVFPNLLWEMLLLFPPGSHGDFHFGASGSEPERPVSLQF